MTLNQETSALLRQSGDAADQEYLTKNTNDAVQLIRCVENRRSTMERLLKEILQYQQGFFLRGEPLKAMTMGDLAERLGLNISTVSRAVRDKSIQFQGRSIPLRDLFTVKLAAPPGGGPVQRRREAVHFPDHPGGEPVQAPLRRAASLRAGEAGHRYLPAHRGEIPGGTGDTGVLSAAAKGRR